MKLGEDEVFLAKRVRLLPTPEQEIQFWKSAGVARWAYNFFLSENRMIYACTGKYTSGDYVRKFINNNLKPKSHTWLKEVSSNVMKQAIKDAEKNLKRFFDGICKFPRLKSKHGSKPSFYVNYEHLYKTDIGFQGEKLGNVKTSEPLPKLLDKYPHYYDPRITYDGMFWYLSVSYVANKVSMDYTEDVFGIDLGIKSLAVISNQDSSVYSVYANINKTSEVRRLERKLRREQRKYTRKRAKNKAQGKDLRECKNLEKQRLKVLSIYRKLTNIRNNYIHQITAEVVKAKPLRVVMEDLNVSWMLKNKYIAYHVMCQKFRMFRNVLEYKCNKYGIDFVLANRFFPSSKTCCHCGHIKKDLKLSDRVYKCPICGLEIDRDLNAAINLANYAS